jgi:hypothetical protein
MQVMKKRELADMKMVIGVEAQEDKLDEKILKCVDLLA